MKVNGVNVTYEGLVPKIEKSLLSKDREALQPHIRAFVDRAVTFTSLSRMRRHPAQRGGSVVADRRVSIADACAMQISDLAEWARGLDEPSVAPLLAQLQRALDSFVEIGLGYLSLDRPSGTLVGRRGAARQRSSTSAPRSPTSPTSSTSPPRACTPTTSSG